MKEYYLVLQYQSILDYYNGPVYELDINHDKKTVKCYTNHYHFDILDEYLWG